MGESIKWLGHAAFMITTAQGKIIYSTPGSWAIPLYPIVLEPGQEHAL